MDLHFERCSMDTFELYYRLKCDDENIYWTGHTQKPDKENLREWYARQLQREDRIMFLIRSNMDKDEAIGYLYLDIVGTNNDVVETGHGVNSTVKGIGIGTKIIKFAIDYCSNNLPNVTAIDGWVLWNNIGSIKNLLKNNYIKTGETKTVFLESTGRDEIMERYTYSIQRTR